MELYRFTLGTADPPAWLETEWLLAQFGKRRGLAVNAYRRYVAKGMNDGNPFEPIEDQLYLGDTAFSERLRAVQSQEDLREFSPAHRRAMALSLEQYATRWPRDEAMGGEQHRALGR